MENVDSLKLACQRLARRHCAIHRSSSSNISTDRSRKRKQQDDGTNDGEAKKMLEQASLSSARLSVGGVVSHREEYTNEDSKLIDFNHSTVAYKGHLRDTPVVETSTNHRVLADKTTGSNSVVAESVDSDEKSYNRDPSTSSKSKRRSTICNCIPDNAYDLLEKLLELDPEKRISATEGLKHPFITQCVS